MNEKYKQPEGGLLQSQEWANVLRAEGKKIIEISSREKIFFGVEQKLPFVGTYVYFPRIFDIDDVFVEEVSRFHSAWVRCDISKDSDLRCFEKCDKKIISSPHDMQPKENFIVDITVAEDELLSHMKSKTRYNIRLARKKGVHVFTTKEQKYIDAFIALVRDTARRKGVSFHVGEHYKKIITQLPEDVIDLYVAEYEGEVIAANLISFYGGVATYLHGATSDEHRNVMAPFLLQWTAIQDAKKRECRWYDFGGIFSHSDDLGKKGITRFKKGFAPKEKIYTSLGSYDLVLSPWRYFLYKIMQRAQKKLTQYL
ncbi:MAG: hypothetical protein CR972_03990 [Candidatus Moraniibacteriota bacterium]|nr:MAG: hypothetical protein CR972_03990 [Candidatus Moranbacteria bacterium]